MATGGWISGRLALEPRVLDNERAPVTLRVVSNRRVKDKTTGEYTPKGDFFTVVVWGDSRKVAKTLSKGDAIVATGRWEQDNYEKNGETREQVQLQAEGFAVVPNLPDDGPTDLPEKGDW